MNGASCTYTYDGHSIARRLGTAVRLRLNKARELKRMENTVINGRYLVDKVDILQVNPYLEFTVTGTDLTRDS